MMTNTDAWRKGPTEEWEAKVAALWSFFDETDGNTFVERMTALTSEFPTAAQSYFELASANDSVGRETVAEPIYRRAIEAGLTGLRRRRAAIQLASTLRNLGHVDESVSILEAERNRTSDELDDAVAGFLALSLIDQGNERKAAALALSRLAPHLVRYNRSMERYSSKLMA